MTQLVFFLEEPSAREMLEGILPKILPEGFAEKIIVFQGKQDLQKSLPIKLRGWLSPNTKFVVLLDQDTGDCIEIKNKFVDICRKANKDNVLVRIACHELESFYLGDLNAVAKAMQLPKLGKLQNKSKYRDPDKLPNPAEELKNIAPPYQKVLGSRKIAPFLDLENNRSNSFNALISGIQSVVGDCS